MWFAVTPIKSSPAIIPCLQRAVLRGEPRLQTGPRPLIYLCVAPIYPFTAEVKGDWKTLAEQLSYLHLPKPFKNPQYTKNINRRVKNLKTVLGQEREREKADRERRRQVQPDAGAPPPEETMEVDGETNRAKTVEEDKEAPTYTSIEAPPSLWPQRRYCDITGLEAPYTDPVTGLRYHDKSVYEVVKNLSASTAKEYLSARGVNSIVK